MKTVGIIGFGSFGMFAADKLAKHVNVLAYSPNTEVPKAYKAELSEVCQADYVMLAVPLAAYESVLTNIQPLLGKKTVIIDVASVKLEPLKLIHELLPDQPYIATHPLFGPESARESLTGHTIVFCESNVSEIELSHVKDFCKKLLLQLETMTADEHDREMAVVQGLTFFISRALNRYGLHEMKFKTPSFQRMLHLAELDNAHTDELMQTILLGNRYALKARQKFMQDIESLNDEIEQQKSKP